MFKSRLFIISSFLYATMVCILLGSVGCGSGDRASGAIGAVNQVNLQRLANLYDRYQVTNRWQGPKNEAEFREFIVALDDTTLLRMGVDKNKIDELFISERDNQPFTIRYGVQGASRGESKPVVFEQTGVNGKRLVGFTGLKQEEVESSEYEKLLAGS